MCQAKRHCSKGSASSHQDTICSLKNGKAEIRQYWDLQFSKPSERPSLKDAENELSNLLAEAVELHMIADVPVGVLLSGGVDSTAVLSFAAERTDKEISSYTVGFSDSGVADERPYARLAAETFGTRHHDMTITARILRTFLPQYVWHMEEPVCEPPAVAMYYVSKLARNYVKVLLSGEGGDEAFAGYNNYRNILWLERLKQVLPALNGAASWGLSRAQFVGSLCKSRQIRAFIERDVPRLLLQPHVNSVPVLRKRHG